MREKCLDDRRDRGWPFKTLVGRSSGHVVGTARTGACRPFEGVRFGPHGRGGRGAARNDRPGPKGPASARRCRIRSRRRRAERRVRRLRGSCRLRAAVALAPLRGARARPARADEAARTGGAGPTCPVVCRTRTTATTYFQWGNRSCVTLFQPVSEALWWRSCSPRPVSSVRADGHLLVGSGGSWRAGVGPPGNPGVHQDRGLPGLDHANSCHNPAQASQSFNPDVSGRPLALRVARCFEGRRCAGAWRRVVRSVGAHLHEHQQSMRASRFHPSRRFPAARRPRRRAISRVSRQPSARRFLAVVADAEFVHESARTLTEEHHGSEHGQDSTHREHETNK